MNISVIIPAYNREGVICEAIRSVMVQTHPAHEIIVVDDASVDNTVETVQREYPSVKVVGLPENKGAQNARAKGIEAATGDWIAFLDSDDLWLPHKLKLQSAKAMEGFDVIHGHGLQLWPGRKPTLMPRPYSGNFCEKIFATYGMLYPAILARRSCFEKAGLPDTSIVAYQEWDMSISLARHFELSFVDAPLFIWKLSENSISTPTPEGQIRSIRGIIQIVTKWKNEILRSHGAELLYKYYVQCAHKFYELGNKESATRCLLQGAKQANLSSERALSDSKKLFSR